MQVVLSSVKLVSQQSQQDHEALYPTHHGSSGRHCGTCCIWNHLLTGGLVSIHLPKQRAVALLVKALLGLHAQAVALGNPADIKVTTPSRVNDAPCKCCGVYSFAEALLVSHVAQSFLSISVQCKTQRKQNR